MRNKIAIKKGDTRSIEQLINGIVKKKNHISSTKKIVPEILVITVNKFITEIQIKNVAGSFSEGDGVLSVSFS